MLKKTEYTNASTTQIRNSEKYEWSYDLLKKLGIPTDILTDVIFPGEIVGKVKPELAEELGIEQVPVFAVASHDTGSAVASVPVVDQKDFIFLYLRVHGHLWVLNLTSLILSVHSTITLQTRGGVNKTIRFLKEHYGTMANPRIKTSMGQRRRTLSFDELERQANAAEPFASLVDPDYAEFQTPGNMPKRIKEYCKKDRSESA